MKLYYLMIVSIFFLSACERKDPSYAYLIEHPKALKQQLERCQAAPNSVYCEKMFAEEGALMRAIGEQQANPEAFGQKILNAEYAFSQAKINKEAALLKLAKLRHEGAAEPSIKAAQQEVDKATLQFKTREEQMKLLLTVTGLNGP